MEKIKKQFILVKTKVYHFIVTNGAELIVFSSFVSLLFLFSILLFFFLKTIVFYLCYVYLSRIVLSLGCDFNYVFSKNRKKTWIKREKIVTAHVNIDSNCVNYKTSEDFKIEKLADKTTCSKRVKMWGQWLPLCFNRNFEVDGCPSKETLLGQSVFLMSATYILFP